MRRILPDHWPIARSTPGSSLGPMKTKATTAISSSSLQLTSNMMLLAPMAAPPAAAGALGGRPPICGEWTSPRRSRRDRSARLVGFGLRRRLRGLVLDRLHGLGLGGFGLIGVVLRH